MRSPICGRYVKSVQLLLRPWTLLEDFRPPGPGNTVAPYETKLRLGLYE